MKLHTFLLSFLILCLLSFYAVSIVHSAVFTITKNYDLNYNGIDFRVQVSVETEPDGTWKQNTPYQINYHIYVSEIDESILKDGDYSLHAFAPWLYINGFTATCEFVSGEAIANLGNIPTLAIKYIPTQEGNQQLRFTLSYEILRNGQVWTPYVTNAPSAKWVSPDSDFINIYVVSQNNNNSFLLYVAVAVIAVIVPIVAILAFKLRKRHPPPP